MKTLMNKTIKNRKHTRHSIKERRIFRLVKRLRKSKRFWFTKPKVPYKLTFLGHNVDWNKTSLSEIALEILGYEGE